MDYFLCCWYLWWICIQLSQKLQAAAKKQELCKNCWCLGYYRIDKDWWRVRLETSVTFILRGTGIFHVLFCSKERQRILQMLVRCRAFFLTSKYFLLLGINSVSKNVSLSPVQSLFLQFLQITMLHLPTHTWWEYYFIRFNFIVNIFTSINVAEIPTLWW